MASSVESPPMSPQDIEQRTKQVIALSDKFIKAAEGVKHSVLLESLLNLYIAVAETHDCCTGSAAKGCAIAAQRLLTASHTRPQGTTIH